MKFKAGIFTMMAVLSAFTLSAQDFAPVGAKWCYEEAVSPFFESPNAPYYYEVLKDTLINDTLCAALQWKKGSSYNDSILEGMVFLYRPADKVYMRLNNQFMLLYDFSLLPGDSVNVDFDEEITIDFPAWLAMGAKVSGYGYKISNDTVAYVNHPDEWGMSGRLSSIYGSDVNLLGSTLNIPLGGQEMNIVGYKDNAYEMGSLQACDILLSEKQKTISKTSPVSVKTALGNVVNIHVPEGFGAYEAAVVDMQGREVTAPKTFSGNASLKLSGLSPAVYVVKISGAAGFSQGFLVPVE